MIEISDIQRRIVTLFEARGAGQMRAALGEMRTGFGGTRRDMQGMRSEAGLLDKQMRALGTTLRYTFAGGAIFGSFQNIRNLGEFSGKLGEIQAIASQPGGMPLLDSQVSQLGDSLLALSTRTATPISDLQAGVLALYSTIGDVPQSEAVEIMDTIARTAKVSQSGIDDTTQALLGMINAFGRGTDEIPKFADQFFRVIQLSAGMPGHIYAQQLGRLQAGATLGGFTPEQLGGLAVSATRFGGSPATSMRGLAQLMRTTLDPSNKESEEALSAIGLDTATRQRLGGYKTLMTILREARSRGIEGEEGRAGGSRISSVLEEVGDAATNEQLGLSGAGAKLLADIFTRSEGRAIAAILTQLQDPGQVKGTKNQTIEQYVRAVSGLAENARDVDSAFDDFMDFNRINQAGTAFHNMGLEIATALGPLFKLGSLGVVELEGVISGNREATLAALGLGGAALWAGNKRATGRGGFRGLGALHAVSATAQNAGSDVLGASPLNPMFVAVVYSLSSPGLFGKKATGIPPTTPPPPARAGTFGKLLRGGALAATAGIGAKGIYDLNQGWSQERQNKAQGTRLFDFLTQKTGGFSVPLGGTMGFGQALRFGEHSRNLSPAQDKIVERVKKGYLSEQNAERMLRRISTVDQLREAGVRVSGTAEVTVNIDRAGEKRTKVKGVIDFAPDFTPLAPTFRGQKTTKRAGGN